MEFACRTKYPKTLPSESGSGTSPTFVKCFDENNEPYLKEVGVRNDYDIIQSYHDDTRIESIIAKYEAGDNSVIGKLQGFYADLSAMPKDLLTAQNSLIKVKEYYNRMPKPVKDKFDTLEKFIGAIGTNELKSLLIPANGTDKPTDSVKTTTEKAGEVIEQK